MSNAKFRVLAIDGGGVRGYLPALFLKNAEAYLNRVRGESIAIGNRFDFIVGTSTGGLIAAALSTGVTAENIFDFYQHDAKSIFGAEAKLGKGFFSPKYDKERLRSALKGLLEEKTFADVDIHLCLVALSLQNAMPRLFKSFYLERNAERLSDSLVDACLATASAPSYFESQSTSSSTNVVDGGLCANNPSMIALVDALNFEETASQERSKPKLKDIVMLSLGTGAQCSMPYDYKKLTNGGGWHWGLGASVRWSNLLEMKSPLGTPPFLEIVMQSQSVLADAQVRFLLNSQGEHGRYLRINPQLKFQMDLDDTTLLDELKNIADLNADSEAFLNEHF